MKVVGFCGENNLMGAKWREMLRIRELGGGSMWLKFCGENDLMDAGQWEVLRIRELGNG